MKRKALIITIIIGLLAGCLLLVTSPVAVEAQGNSPVTAGVDRSSLTTDETLLLTVSVDKANGNPSPPVLPVLDGFDVLGSSSGTQITIVNGEMRMQASYQYQLRPTRAGELAIGPITVEVDGQTYQTAPATISVAQGTGQPQPAQPAIPQFPSLPGMPPSAPSQPSAPAGSIPPPAQLNGQEFYAEATVDNPAPYQGEQVIYTFRFYQGTDLLDQPVYQPPTFTGFWHEGQPEQKTYTTEAAGRSYYVTEIQTALFPTVSGELTIEPARLEIPGGFFSRGQLFETQPLTLSVRTLPPNAPTSFRGAVGQFTIQSSADRAESKVNDAVTLNVTVEGQGNLESLGDLEWNVGPEWRPFDSQSQNESQFANGRLTSRRTYEQLLLPTVAGDLTLPVVEFSYFDPATAQYETIHTAPITVRVQADGSAPAAAAPPPAVVPVSTAALNTAALRPLKAAPATWANGRALVEQTGYWLLWTVPLLVLTGHAGWQWWQKRHNDSAETRLSQQASKKAYHSIQAARRQPASRDTAQEAAVILTTYLAEKLNRPLTGLTHDGLTALLQGQGLHSDLAARVQACLEAGDASRYMPNAAETAAGLLQETEQLIRELEKALG